MYNNSYITNDLKSIIERSKKQGVGKPNQNIIEFYSKLKPKGGK